MDEIQRPDGLGDHGIHARPPRQKLGALRRQAVGQRGDQDDRTPPMS
jgi:hypothetical protein